MPTPLIAPPPSPKRAGYSLAQARQEFPAYLRRAQVMALGARVGLSEYAMRLLIEGTDAAIQPTPLPGGKRGYFLRERVCEVLSFDN